MYHHVDRIGAAVSALVSHSHIKQRLIEAYEKNLRGINEEDLPLQMRQSFADLRQMMTGVAPLNGEGSIRATVRKMSVCQADECARLILSLYSDIVRYSDNVQELLPLDVTDSQKVPPFLIKSN
jgi:hypothetical protein